MRLAILVVLLLASVGGARWMSQRRYPMVEVEVPGTGRHYEVWRREDQDIQGLRMLYVIMLVEGEDPTAWREQVHGLLPWMSRQATRGTHRGAAILATRPGFARLFAPTGARWYWFYWSGRDWELREERDATEELGLEG